MNKRAEKALRYLRWTAQSKTGKIKQRQKGTAPDKISSGAGALFS